MCSNDLIYRTVEYYIDNRDIGTLLTQKQTNSWFGTRAAKVYRNTSVAASRLMIDIEFNCSLPPSFVEMGMALEVSNEAGRTPIKLRRAVVAAKLGRRPSVFQRLVASLRTKGSGSHRIRSIPSA